MVGSSQDRYPCRRRLQRTEKSSRGRTLWRDKGRKRKFEATRPPIAAQRVKKQYTAREKTVYKAGKVGERKVKREGSVAPKGEVKHGVWAEAHGGVDQKVVDKRKKDNECTRCGMNNHTWKVCPKAVQVSAVYRGPAKRQMTRLMRAEAMPPGSYGGRRWSGRKLKTSRPKAPNMGL